jgi:hypothetical protein
LYTTHAVPMLVWSGLTTARNGPNAILQRVPSEDVENAHVGGEEGEAAAAAAAAATQPPKNKRPSSQTPGAPL